MAKDAPLRTQIYLMAEVGLDPMALSRALDAGTVACVLVRAANADGGALEASILALRPVAQERQVAFLIENQVRLARQTGCDGVHLTGDGQSIERARQELDDEAIVGLYCGASRHAGMDAAEAGADYVAFGGDSAEDWWRKPADPDLLAWWQALVTTPCVALSDDDLQGAGEMAAAGADFVAVGTCIWSHPHGPDTAIRELNAVLGIDGRGSDAGQAKDD